MLTFCVTVNVRLALQKVRAYHLKRQSNFSAAENCSRLGSLDIILVPSTGHDSILKKVYHILMFPFLLCSNSIDDSDGNDAQCQRNVSAGGGAALMCKIILMHALESSNRDN